MGGGADAEAGAEVDRGAKEVAFASMLDVVTAGIPEEEILLSSEGPTATRVDPSGIRSNNSVPLPGLTQVTIFCPERLT